MLTKSSHKTEQKLSVGRNELPSQVAFFILSRIFANRKMPYFLQIYFSKNITFFSQNILWKNALQPFFIYLAQKLSTKTNYVEVIDKKHLFFYNLQHRRTIPKRKFRNAVIDPNKGAMIILPKKRKGADECLLSTF